MSSPKPSSPTPTKGSSRSNIAQEICDVDECCRSEFIYGGPFIKVEKIEPFMSTATPINIQLQGTFKKSFAYYSLRERLPIILTKIIDYLSREGGQIKSKTGAGDDEIRNFIKHVSKLKSDLVTNKPYEPLKANTADAKLWNTWLASQENARYFTNIWVFTECYVYRSLRDGCELGKSLHKFDPFDEQKDKSLSTLLEAMCVVADKLVTMLPVSDKDKRKQDFMTLLKICLWANKCDLSLSAGEPVTMGGSAKDGGAPAAPVDPFQMIIDYKDKLLVDDTAKIADQVVAKAETMGKAIEGPVASPTGSTKGSLAPSAPSSAPEEEAPKIPCPAKMVLAQTVIFDIVCDNSGYELFADLCLAHFLISQNIVKKVRFHVKNMPWFVSDVTRRDFKFVIDSCANANYNRSVPELKKEPKEGEAPEPPRIINADNLRQLGQQWKAYLDDGSFVVLDEAYWTWPHCYKDMKKYDYNLYRNLQYAVAILFKGDLNYRKLLGEKNWNPVTGFETALQGFTPAPIIAVRTVKADLICGLPNGKFQQINKIDEKWMEKGDYGVIQFCAKAEPLKPSDRPCIDYGETCLGTICPVHTDM